MIHSVWNQPISRVISLVTKIMFYLITSAKCIKIFFFFETFWIVFKQCDFETLVDEYFLMHISVCVFRRHIAVESWGMMWTMGGDLVAYVNKGAQTLVLTGKFFYWVNHWPKEWHVCSAAFLQKSISQA